MTNRYRFGIGRGRISPGGSDCDPRKPSLGLAHLAPCAGRCSVTADGVLGVDVWAYSNGAMVELFVNGKSVGASSPVAGNLSHFEWPNVPLP